MKNNRTNVRNAVMKTQRLPPLESLPDYVRSRIERGSQIFTDANWCARYFGPSAESAGVHVDDLLRAGMTWCDCQWLWMAGYIAAAQESAAQESAAQESAAQESAAQECARTGDRRPSRRIPPPLGAEVRVVLTQAGAAELRRLRLSGVFAADRTAKNGQTDGDEIVPIHYSSRRNKLFLGDTLVLRLWPNARNQHLLLQSFNDALWPKCISSPFRWQSSAVRSQTVRDAVYGLNQLQDPLRIVFKSSQKGAQILYEFAAEDDSPRRDRRERYGRLPLRHTTRPETAGRL